MAHGVCQRQRERLPSSRRLIASGAQETSGERGEGSILSFDAKICTYHIVLRHGSGRDFDDRETEKAFKI